MSQFSKYASENILILVEPFTRKTLFFVAIFKFLPILLAPSHFVCLVVIAFFNRFGF